MVLLTSSTVSVLLSSSVVGLFTILLFLSGYVLQQKSVQSIQAALRPPDLAGSHAGQLIFDNEKRNSIPLPNIHLVTPNREQSSGRQDRKIAKRFGDPVPNQHPIHGSRSSVANGDDASTSGRQAYLQILTRPSASDICSTILLFDTLRSNSTIPSDQVVLYPKSWEVNSPTKSIASALQLLRKASLTHNVVLHPIESHTGRDRMLSESQLLRDASSKLALYERIMFIRAPGLLLDAEKMDDLFLSKSGPPPSSSRRDNRRANGDQEAWTPTALPRVGLDLPPAFLVTSELLPSGLAAVTSHILNPSWKDTFVESAASTSTRDNPAYVYFEGQFGDRKRRNGRHYLDWAEKAEATCEGIDISY